MHGLEKRFIATMQESVTFIGFGALEIGRDWGLGTGESVQRPEEHQAAAVLKTVLDVGINLIDTAAAYHRSEERIGRSIANHRQDYLLATKCGEYSNEPATYYDYSYQGIKSSIDRSLQLLQTDIIDIIQIHFGPNPAEVLDRGETVGAMKAAQQEGKVRFLGASIDGELATRCIISGDFAVMQMAYNLLHQDNAANIALAGKHGMGVFIRSGLDNGKLTARVMQSLDAIPEKATVQALLALAGNDPQQLTAIALQFLYRNHDISSVLLGTKSEQHLRANFALLERTIDDVVMEEARHITAVS